MTIFRRIANYLRVFLASNFFFFVALVIFVISAGYIAIASLYPMAFDEEFHVGLIRIYATSWLPYGTELTGDMAQFGAATADASYLFHYLMSFPYRFFVALSLPEDVIIIGLRLINVVLAAGALVVYRRAILEAGISRRITNVVLALVMMIPVFVMLAAQINYDNLLLVVFAWAMLIIVRLTNATKAGRLIPASLLWQLFAALLIGMSIKYAFLPLALGMFIWLVGLMIYQMRSKEYQWFRYLVRIVRQGGNESAKKRYLLGGVVFLSLLFAFHYVSNTLTYGSPIPSCDQVFTPTECQAYGPWQRNREYQASKDETFRPLSYWAYMVEEWFPDMAQRLTFAVAGKTNDFQTKLPLPLVEYGFIVPSVIGFGCLIIQTVKRRLPWLSVCTMLLSFIYVTILSIQLYGDYVDTAQPVAINGRYLLPLLPLVGVALIYAIRQTFNRASAGILSGVTVAVFIYLFVSGAGISTYLVLAEQHWFWPGFGQRSYAWLHTVFETFVLPLRYKS